VNQLQLDGRLAQHLFTSVAEHLFARPIDVDELALGADDVASVRRRLEQNAEALFALPQRNLSRSSRLDQAPLAQRALDGVGQAREGLRRLDDVVERAGAHGAHCALLVAVARQDQHGQHGLVARPGQQVEGIAVCQIQVREDERRGVTGDLPLGLRKRGREAQSVTRLWSQHTRHCLGMRGVVFDDQNDRLEPPFAHAAELLLIALWSVTAEPEACQPANRSVTSREWLSRSMIAVETPGWRGATKAILLVCN